MQKFITRQKKAEMDCERLLREIRKICRRKKPANAGEYYKVFEYPIPKFDLADDQIAQFAVAYLKFVKRQLKNTSGIIRWEEGDKVGIYTYKMKFDLDNLDLSGNYKERFASFTINIKIS
ncbi:MAG: hypothetical protein N3E51_02530 [Candidatus Micrarchaeota archaeon]|nr:hypothetical protein [Candidatus Micrarchaeota archaeon]